MSRSIWSRIARTLVLASAAVIVLPTLVAAQGGPGFLFKKPSVTLRVETGYGIQFANSDIFDLTREQLTVSKHDFYSPYIGGELGAVVSERWDVVLGFGFQRSEKASEFRDWVDLDDNPIEQITAFRVVPVTVSAKYYFRDRGRSIGRFAWVPETLTPYVGVGAGAAVYRFEQVGDFVDFETFDIFYDRFVSTGSTPLFRGLAGVSVALGGQVVLSGEMRYSYASADMGSDFDGFDAMDLSGFQGVIGFGLRF